MPSTYTPEKANAVLDLMREGISLRKSCKAVGVPIQTFRDWVDADPELAGQYMRARAEMLDVRAEELEDIGEEAENADSAVKVAGLRLKADNRKWLLSKLAPKKYGDRVALAGDPESPLQVEVLDAAKLSTSTLAELMAAKDAANRS